MRTHRLNHVSVFVILIVTFVNTFVPFGITQAESTADVSDEINELNQSILEKKQSVGQLNRQIKEYEKKINQKESEKATLSLELDLIQNRISKTELEIEETNTEIDLVNSEVALLEKELEKLEQKLAHDRDLIVSILQEMQVNDHSLPLQVFFGTDSFSDIFDQVDQLETISHDLEQAIEHTKTSRITVEEKKDAKLAKREQLDALQENLIKEKNTLNASVGAQETLIAQTQRSESEFQALLRELKQEQQFIDQEISAIQSEIEGKLSASDKVGDSSALSWPLNPEKGISALFHDPTYPFRHLFEHPGIDLPAPTGTPVKAVAAGYVAWVKVGRQYGNYIMVIHANGTATLYAHLSRTDVVPDQFVARGKVIGAVGSTGLSTGPHLHFEVRKNGIPTNPLNYLIPR